MRLQRSATPMRDLLYLSDSKMRTLIPQLPDRVRKRLAVEAGVNAGVVSVKATLANDGGSREVSSFEALGAVIDMIEEKYGERSRNDADLRVGDWIRLDEVFLYGRASTSCYPTAERYDLVYFAAEELPPVVLLASGYHILDLRQAELSPQQGNDPGLFYMEALHEEFRHLRELPGGGAVGALPDPNELEYGDWGRAVSWLCRIDARAQRNGIRWMPPTKLAGHARVLAVGNAPGGDHERRVLATPLYLEYVPR
ncbi:SAVMC3_10250 family protein [Streptomyces cupreus]|uniref:Uncharacterized protein n=1 Tax=Streptomyces cupreus TaxID=2759956 RepID=A0A7X1MD90_9ACTN|nr:SAVMC3_10250 family protein [Streptomyces cupreus]MBC2906743.1 hypothetical protein [Streptomyces cupreus]